jgi:hypothetical protein
MIQQTQLEHFFTALIQQAIDVFQQSEHINNMNLNIKFNNYKTCLQSHISSISTLLIHWSGGICADLDTELIYVAARSIGTMCYELHWQPTADTLRFNITNDWLYSRCSFNGCTYNNMIRIYQHMLSEAKEMIQFRTDLDPNAPMLMNDCISTYIPAGTAAIFTSVLNMEPTVLLNSSTVIPYSIFIKENVVNKFIEMSGIMLLGCSRQTISAKQTSKPVLSFRQISNPIKILETSLLHVFEHINNEYHEAQLISFPVPNFSPFIISTPISKPLFVNQISTLDLNSLFSPLLPNITDTKFSRTMNALEQKQNDNIRFASQSLRNIISDPVGEDGDVNGMPKDKDNEEQPTDDTPDEIDEPYGGPAAQAIAVTVAESAGEGLTHSLRLAMSNNIAISVNRTCTRKLARMLTKTLTISLTDSLSNLFLMSLSRPIIDVTSRVLTHGLTPSLTLSLASTITQALTRSSHEDYFCYYCLHSKHYCAYCSGSMETTYQRMYYMTHYATYYSRYYTNFYSLIGDMSIFTSLDMDQIEPV